MNSNKPCGFARFARGLPGRQLAAQDPQHQLGAFGRADGGSGNSAGFRGHAAPLTPLRSASLPTLTRRWERPLERMLVLRVCPEIDVVHSRSHRRRWQGARSGAYRA